MNDINCVSDVSSPSYKIPASHIIMSVVSVMSSLSDVIYFKDLSQANLGSDASHTSPGFT